MRSLRIPLLFVASLFIGYDTPRFRPASDETLETEGGYG
jgi:hypothetical protein